jgi:hypothetical protein
MPRRRSTKKQQQQNDAPVVAPAEGVQVTDEARDADGTLGVPVAPDEAAPEGGPVEPTADETAAAETGDAALDELADGEQPAYTDGEDFRFVAITETDRETLSLLAHWLRSRNVVDPAWLHALEGIVAVEQDDDETEAAA